MEDKSIPLAERCLRWHKAKHSFDPKYMSNQFTEYKIVPKKGKWVIRAWNNMIQNNQTAGYFTTHREAEMHLIAYLAKYNKHHYARYPGCPKPRPTSSTEHFLKDWSPKPVP